MSAVSAERSIEEIIIFLAKAAPLLREKRIIAGFDGFIDTIVKPVKVYDPEGNHQFFGTIDEFGNFIAAHAHKGASIQYRTMERKPGGNVANAVKAFDALGLNVTAIGMFSAGGGAIDPLFSALGKERYSFFPAGLATVMEFDDGKIFLSSAHIAGLDNGQKVIALIEKAFNGFGQAASGADITAFLNWSELPFAHNLWIDIYERYLSEAGTDKTRSAFFDLCDTGAKTHSEIEALVSMIKKTGEKRKTILSLNKNEASDIYKKIAGKEDPPEKIAGFLYQCFALDELVIHQHNRSIAISDKEGMVIKQCVHNKNPKISTGAGDHFNAAYCCGCLAGLSLAEKLKFANGYSGAYVAKGHSPLLNETLMAEGKNG